MTKKRKNYSLKHIKKISDDLIKETELMNDEMPEQGLIIIDSFRVFQRLLLEHLEDS